MKNTSKIVRRCGQQGKYLVSRFTSHFNFFQLFRVNFAFYNEEEFMESLSIAPDLSNNAVVEGNRGVLIWAIEERFYRSGTTSLAYMEQDFELFYSKIIFKAHSPFIEVYNDILGWMKAGGLTETWRKYEYLPSKTEETGPQVLTMDHLRLAFNICLFPLIPCSLVFFAELVKPRIVNKYKKNFKGWNKKKTNFVENKDLELLQEVFIELDDDTSQNRSQSIGDMLEVHCLEDEPLCQSVQVHSNEAPEEPQAEDASKASNSPEAPSASEAPNKPKAPEAPSAP